MAFFRDPVWQFVGVVVAVLALGLPIVLHFTNRSRKLIILSIKVIPIIELSKALKKRFEIKFDGRQLDSAYLSIISLMNRGALPIERKEFDEPIMIDLSPRHSFENIEILSFDLSDNTISLEASILDRKLQISPFLLNRGEKVNVKIISGGDEPRPKVAIRIVGINLLPEERYDNRPSLKVKKWLLEVLPLLPGAMITAYFLIKIIK